MCLLTDFGVRFQSELLYDPNEEIDVVNQVLNFDNCLYEYKDSAEFMAFVDFDDLIQPQKYMNIYDELKYFAFMYPNAASFEFQWPPTLAIACILSLIFVNIKFHNFSV